MDINWKEMLVAFAGLATVLALVLGIGEIQRRNTLDVIRADMRLLNDKMTNIETEHAELRSLYEKVGELRSDVNHIKDDVSELQSDVNHIKDDVSELQSDVNHIKDDVGVLQTEVASIRRDLNAVRANQDTMRADLDKILTILESGE